MQTSDNKSKKPSPLEPLIKAVMKKIPTEERPMFIHSMSSLERADIRVKRFFPHAMRQQDVVDAALQITQEIGIDSQSTLFAHSVCPDEINHDDGDITDIFREHFDGVFSLGGLAGIPFSGKTGFAAYAAHVPDEGNIFVLFAPHCSVSPEGKCGFYHRHGQAALSTACGAAIGAYNAAQQMTEVPEIDILSRDYQMDYIKRLVWQQKSRIASAKEPHAELTYVIYEHIKDYIMDVIGTKYIGTGKIAILGGIQINVAHNADWFEPSMFIVMDQHGIKDYTKRLWEADTSAAVDAASPSKIETPPVLKQPKSDQ